MNANQSSRLHLSVANDFSTTPGARYKIDGPFSAEEFFDNLLLPKYKEARKKGLKLVVDLDRVAGYATSFLQGSFGNLANQFGADEVFTTIEIITNDEPYLKDYVNKYIQEANKVVLAGA